MSRRSDTHSGSFWDILGFWIFGLKDFSPISVFIKFGLGSYSYLCGFGSGLKNPFKLF